MESTRKIEYSVAVGAFLAAVGLAFTSLMISETHDIASGVLMMCAQFLMLTAAIFGIDYKFKTHENDLMKRFNSQPKKEAI